jgi:RNA methyltransferase, TrmH family
MSDYTSAQHVDVKTLRRLVGRRLARLETGLCVVEGSKVIAEAIRSRATISHLFVAGAYSDEVVEQLLATKCVVRRLPEGLLETILETVSPQPVVALVSSAILPTVKALEPLEIEEQRVGLQSFVVVGVDIRDPGNAGTMIRSAELSGASAVIFLGTSVDVTSPKVIRSTAGALFHVPVVQSEQTLLSLKALRSVGYRVLGTAVHGQAVDYTSDDVLTGRVAVVLGNEARGLDQESSSMLDGWITIPMFGKTESLNVSMAATVLCFEASRQRRSLTSFK